MEKVLVTKQILNKGEETEKVTKIQKNKYTATVERGINN